MPIRWISLFIIFKTIIHVHFAPDASDPSGIGILPHINILFAKRETILPAPESAHAIRGAIDEALRCRESREAKTILFGLTGTGYFDMTAYEDYLNGKMSDSIPTDADLQKGFDSLPKIPQNEGI